MKIYVISYETQTCPPENCVIKAYTDFKLAQNEANRLEAEDGHSHWVDAIDLIQEGE